MSLDLFQSLPRPLLKYAAVAMFVWATLHDDFSQAKYDALLFLIVGLYAIRGGEKVAGIMKGEGRE